MHYSNSIYSHHNNSDSEHAMRVRLTQNNSTLDKQNSYPNFIPFICSNFDSTHAWRVHLTQNQLIPAQHCNNFQLHSPNHNISVCDFDPRKSDLLKMN